jgi:hypothetical protein
MTLPCERYNALKSTEQFLVDLLDPKKTPRVPKAVRQQAYYCLRHFPGGFHLDYMATKCPDVLSTMNPVDELTMLVHNYESKKNGNR